MQNGFSITPIALPNPACGDILQNKSPMNQ